MTEEEFRNQLVRINRDFYDLFKRYTNERDAIEFQEYMVALYENKDVDTSMMIMLMEKLRNGIYFKNGRKLSLFDFRMYGRYLFQKYLGDDYAEEFSDYMVALLFSDDVETTVLYDMLWDLRSKIALTGKGKIGRLDYEFICEMMECEEMMKIIEENSIIMDNDDE